MSDATLRRRASRRSTDRWFPQELEYPLDAQEQPVLVHTLERCFFCHTKIIAPKNPRTTSENPPNPTFFRNSTTWQQLTSNFVTPPFRGTDPNFPTRHARPNWLAMFVAHDVPASSTLTQERFGWHPTGPGLIADLERMNWIN
jgi:hypothetical protein